MSVGLIENVDLQEKLSKENKDKSIIFWQIREDQGKAAAIHPIEGSDTKEILEKILSILPNPEILDEERFKVCIGCSKSSVSH